MSLRVVFDTSTLVGAAIRPDSIPDRALQIAMGSHELLVSDETLHELEAVLVRKRFDRYAKQGERRLFIEAIRVNATQVAVKRKERIAVREACRDRNDEKFLALCLSANADVMVSSDQDLLVLHPWHGIPVLTPTQFFEQFAG